MTVIEARAALIIVFTLAAWAFGLVPEPLPTLIFFLLAVLFNVASLSTVFSGFNSPAWWLVFGGGVIGVAIKTSGLGSRLATLMFSGNSTSYRVYVTKVAAVALGLAFVMPSTTGRILLLTPIVMSLADGLGFKAGSNGRTGLILAVAAVSYMPATSILPANVPNSVLLGAAEVLYGIKLSYGAYLLLHFPILGICKTALIVWAICYLFPEARPCTIQRAATATPFSKEERHLLVVICLSLLMFATDFVHGISPAWIAVASAIACLWPVTNLVSAKSFSENVHMTPLIYVAGFLGLGAVIFSTGLGATMGKWLLDLANISSEHPLSSLGALAAISAGIGFFTTLPSLPAVLTPLSQEFAASSGLPLYSVLMLQVPIFSTVFLPYQSPPMVIGMVMGGVSLRNGTKLCLLVAAITVVILLPLDILWWKILGYLP